MRDGEVTMKTEVREKESEVVMTLTLKTEGGSVSQGT